MSYKCFLWGGLNIGDEEIPYSGLQLGLAAVPWETEAVFGPIRISICNYLPPYKISVCGRSTKVEILRIPGPTVMGGFMDECCPLADIRISKKIIFEVNNI